MIQVKLKLKKFKTLVACDINYKKPLYIYTEEDWDRFLTSRVSFYTMGVLRDLFKRNRINDKIKIQLIVGQPSPRTHLEDFQDGYIMTLEKFAEYEDSGKN